MTVKELKNYLAAFGEHRDDDRIVVVVEGSKFGALPCVGVKAMLRGSDWDAHKLLIFTEHPVVKVKEK